MSVSSFLPRHIFGCRGDLQDGLHLVEEKMLLYAAGHSVVLYNTETRAQRFIAGSQDTDCICAIAVTPTKKHVALAERADKGIVTIFDLQSLKRRKVLTSSDASAKDISSLAFSADGRLLAVQGGPPEWSLTVWAWERAKLLGSVRTADSTGRPVYQVCFSPGGLVDPNMLTVSGHGIFKLYRAENLGLRSVQHSLTKRDTTNFTAQCWISGDRQAVGTENGDVLICDGTDLKATMHSVSSGRAITAIAAHAKGLVVGTAGGACLLIEREDDGTYDVSSDGQVPDSGDTIKSILSTGEDSFVVLTASGKLLKVVMALKSKALTAHLEPLNNGSNAGELMGMSGCLRKPLLATSGVDKTLRLWNYKHRAVDLSKLFSEEMFGITLHPSGYTAAVGFADRLRLLTLLLDDVKCIKEIPIRSCRVVAFSHGGHLLAAASGTTVSIYNTYTCEQTGVLRGHSGKVKCVAWGSDDNYLTTGGAEGAVYEWALKDCKRCRETVIKGCSYTCLVIGASGSTIYAVSSDDRLKALEEDGSVGLRVASDIETGCAIHQIALAAGGRQLFAATSKGSVRAYRLPLGQDFQELHCSNLPLKQLALSPDACFLFAANTEGLVFVFAVKDRDPSRLEGSEKREDQLPWSDDVLLSRSGLEEKQQQISGLESQVVELELAKEYALRVRELAAQEQLAGQAEAHAEELRSHRQLLQAAEQQREHSLAERDRREQVALEKHQAQVAAMEEHCQEKVSTAEQQTSALAAAASAAAAEAAQQAARAEADHLQILKTLQDKHDALMKEQAGGHEALQAAKTAQEKEFAVLKQVMEDVTDEEIEELKARYEGKLAREREAGIKLQGEHGVMRSKFASMAQQLSQVKADLAASRDSQQAAEQAQNVLEQRLSESQAVSRKDKSIIAEMGAHAAVLAAKTRQLEDVKLGLESRLQEAASQLQGADTLASDLHKQIKDLQAVIAKLQKAAAAQGVLVAELRMQSSAARKDAARQQQLLLASQSTIRGIQAELQDAAQLILEPEALKAAVKALYYKHASSAEPCPIDKSALEVAQREKQQLEGVVHSLKLQLRKASEQHRQDKARAVQEQGLLLTEVEHLRNRTKPAMTPAASSTTRVGLSNQA